MWRPGDENLFRKKRRTLVDRTRLGHPVLLVNIARHGLLETLVFSSAVALPASAWPAYRAARTNIAQALRYVG